MELGNDLEVRVEPKLMNWQKNSIHFDNMGNVDGWTINAHQGPTDLVVEVRS